MRWALTFGMLLGAVPAWAASNVLSWSDNSTNEANFVIERKTEACTGTTVPFTYTGAEVVAMPPVIVSTTPTEEAPTETLVAKPAVAIVADTETPEHRFPLVSTVPGARAPAAG